jgi:hypothetical protein
VKKGKKRSKEGMSEGWEKVSEKVGMPLSSTIFQNVSIVGTT